MDNLTAFYDLAKKMNEKLSLIPLLFGSTGLQLLVDDELNPADIDIAVPQIMRPTRSEMCADLTAFMQNEGYALTDLNEGEFAKGEIVVEISTLGDFKDYAGVDVTECPIIQANGAIFKLLTLEQFLSVYTSSAECEWRHRDVEDVENYVNEDQVKAEIVKKALAR